MDKTKQIVRLQVAFNPENKSHRDLLEWIDAETVNRSSFIRETLLMRMLGVVGTVKPLDANAFEHNEISREAALEIISV